MEFLLRKIWNASFGILDGQYMKELDAEVNSSCDSLLDVGCGFNSPVRQLTHKPKSMVGVDAFVPAIEQSRAAGIHTDYVQCSVLEIARKFPPKSFDYVIAMELIEHLEAADGLELLAQMERIARKKVILSTPNGFLPQGEEFGNPMQKHLSGWTVPQFNSLGYRCVGLEGLWFLRGEMAGIKWWPRHFWKAISLVSQFVTRKNSRLAFRLLAVKDMPAEMVKAKAA